mmetsp:Transcript_5150/g.10499  ORF Transcript_5150/g.10499 Transcript_5150/m.10499 type:complete len:305 (-) Transcript_5150:194-1108(-)
MKTRVLLPSRLVSLKRLHEHVKTAHVVVLPIDQARFVWEEIRPCVFRDDDDDSFDDVVACRMMKCLFEFLRKYDRMYQIERDQLADYRSKDEPSDEPIAQDPINTAFWERTLVWRPRKARSIVSVKCTILIVPSILTNLAYSWEERLIGLEHNLIRAQSVAGLISTLGGGYFMTRRLQTANTLAREQQRIALLLGNKEMYYKCIINQAYNEIYGGHFKLARLHILQVWMALANEKHFDERPVLQNMCRSAMLFRKRVRDARHQMPVVNGNAARVVDDFSRIRVVQDRSSHHDLKVTPLARAKIF